MSVVVIIVVAAIALVAFFLFRGKASPQLPSDADRDIEEETDGGKAALLPARKAKAEPRVSTKPPVDAGGPADRVESVQTSVEGKPEEGRSSAQPDVEPEQAPLARAAHDVEGLRRGLDKSRRPEGFFGRLSALLRGKKEISSDIATQIEDVLLTSDVGVQTTQAIVDMIRDSLSRKELSDPEIVWDALRAEARRILGANAQQSAILIRTKPTVILLVGVNGAGKTTTIGKLATRFKAQGKSVLLAAGDTFRAAAVQQLKVWGGRIGVDVVHGKDGADPGSVIFDAVKKAQENNIDIVLADTAGRLHTKTNLMAELKKLVKTTSKAMETAPHEVLLVVDATNGQNAVAQAKEFCQELPISGMVLTKLDGTAKGGFVLGIAAALQLPVKLIGLGEKATDLHDFDAEDFVEALLGNPPEGTSG